jgi:hypothetical protein
MPPEVWLTILFALFAVAGYLLWVFEARPGLRHLLTFLAAVFFVLAIVFYETAPRTGGDADAGQVASSPAGMP